MNVNIQFVTLSTTCAIRVNRQGSNTIEILIPTRNGFFVDKKTAEEARQIATCKNWEEVIWVIRTLNKMRRFEYNQNSSNVNTLNYFPLTAQESIR